MVELLFDLLKKYFSIQFFLYITYYSIYNSIHHIPHFLGFFNNKRKYCQDMFNVTYFFR